jgi:hypothetical protein
LHQQEGLAPTISLPGGGSSELDIVMKLHKVERHIRNSKLKVCDLALLACKNSEAMIRRLQTTCRNMFLW